MTTLRIACPECGATLRSDQTIPLKAKVKCPQCQKRFVPFNPKEEPAQTPDPAETRPLNELASPPVLRVNAVESIPLPRLQIPGYTILAELGQGGMGVVYKAWQIKLERAVALKMIRSGSHAHATEVARFRTEAMAVAKIQHPNIVQIYEVGEHEGSRFIALEFVNGPTLAKVLSGTPQPPRPTAELIENLARAIFAAHQRGIIHRDLKPSNILLARLPHGADATAFSSGCEQLFGAPKITDFGLAKRLDGDDGHTRTGDFLGTPRYMAPEQAGGNTLEVGPAADIYALGTILYEMLTGRPPFVAPTVLETLRQATTEEVVPPRMLQPTVPRDLQTICLKCLRKDPRQRYPTALALAEDLRRFLHSEPIQARSPGMAERFWRWCLRYPVAAGLLASFVCCVGFGFWYLGSVTDNLVRASALENVARQSELLIEVNDIYSDVAKRAKAGKLSVTHDYHGNPAAIPVPATFSIELGNQVSDKSQTGLSIRLYSDYPFKSRRNGGPRDDFEREALAHLTENPETPYYRFEDYKGRPSLRYATARLMQESCVNCHNTHPESPKTDWQVGDLRGVVEAIQPLDQDMARTRQGLRGATIFMGVVCGVLLGLAALVLFVGRSRRAGSAL